MAVPRRIAITGIGVVAPCGVGVDAFWDGLQVDQGTNEREVADWDPSSLFDNPKEARRSDRFSQFALAAAAEALAQAGPLDDTDPTRIGVLVGTGIGGIGTNEEQIVIQHVKGSRRVSPFLVPMMMPNAAAASISMRHGFQGPCEAVVTACAAGTHSIGNAGDVIRLGRCDVVIAGGAEAPRTPTAIAGFRNMTALSNTGISMPFDADRDGFVISEGAGILVMEDWDHAVNRGATIIAEYLGSASTADAHHITAPSPTGHGAVSCMQKALEDADLQPSDIAQINAHGTSTPLNDAAEAKAMAEVFGVENGPAVTSTKGVTGHALGAAGAIEAVAVIESMRRKLIPPTMGLKAVDPELPAIDVVAGVAREWTPGPTMSNSFGFGGHNGTIILGPV